MHISAQDRLELRFGDQTLNQKFVTDVSHTYAFPGVYTVELIQWSGGIYNEEKDNYFDQVGKTLQRTTITVDGDPSSQAFSAAPTSGFRPPLVVTFTSHYGDGNPSPSSHVDGADTIIDFGDGSKPQWIHCEIEGGSLGGGKCITPTIIQHTYTQNGTYTATRSE